MKNKIQISIIVGVILLIGALVLLKSFGYLAITGVNSQYNKGEYLSFAISSKQSSASYIPVDCYLTAYLNGVKLKQSSNIYCGHSQCDQIEVGYLNQVGSNKIQLSSSCQKRCPSTVTFANDVTSVNLITKYGCTQSPSGWDESITFQVVDNSVPPVPNCGANQVLKNNVCVAAPCKYTKTSPYCDGRDYVKPNCYTAKVEGCMSPLVCSPSEGCVEAPQMKINCYKCINGQLKGETVYSCSGGYTEEQPKCEVECSSTQELVNGVCEDIPCSDCGTCDKTCSSTQTLDSVSCSCVDNGVVKEPWYQIFWNWLKSLFSI